MSKFNRYKFTKKIYPDYIVLLTRKEKYITFDIDLKLINYLDLNEDISTLENLHINYVILDDLEIIDIKKYDDNKYENYCLKMGLTKIIKKLGNKLMEYY